MEILLADDHRLFSDSLQIVLENTFPSCRVTKTRTWQGVTEYTNKAFFDLLLLDFKMPVNSKKSWRYHLNSAIDSKQGPICIISGISDQDKIQQLSAIGISGYIQKTCTLKQMQLTLRALVAEENHSSFPPPSLTPNYNSPSRKNRPITNRQQQILTLLSSGHSNKTIAQQLSLSEGTIKRHVHNLYRALKAKNRADAVRIGQELNLLNL